MRNAGLCRVPYVIASSSPPVLTVANMSCISAGATANYAGNMMIREDNTFVEQRRCYENVRATPDATRRTGGAPTNRYLESEKYKSELHPVFSVQW